MKCCKLVRLAIAPQSRHHAHCSLLAKRPGTAGAQEFGAGKLQRRMRGVRFMNPVFFLLAISALAGILLGLYLFRLAAIVISTLLVSVLAATVLHGEGFGFFAGITIIVACQTVHQLGYVLGSLLANPGRG